MSEAFSCNYARTAVRTIAQGLYTHSGLPSEALHEIKKQYHEVFKDTPSMHLTCQASKLITIKSLLKKFNEHWYPKENRVTYLETFSCENWKALSNAQKTLHTLHQCRACPAEFPQLTSAFPHKRYMKKKTINITPEDLSSTARLGLSIVSQLDTISQQNFGQSALSVLTSTPRTKLMLNPGRTERQNQMRTVVKKVKECIQDTMNETSITSVMAHRISWTTFDTLRKSALEQRLPKRQRDDREAQAQSSHTDDLHSEPPTKKCRIGHQENNMDIARLLNEARSWTPNDVVNWSELARRYGLVKSNGGQIIKQILQKHDIPNACIVQRASRKPRRGRKKLPGNIAFPMAKPTKHHRLELKKQIESGKLLLGDKVVETQHTNYKVDVTDTRKVVETSNSVYAHKIRLLDIRQKLLTKHEELGLIRNKPDQYYDKLPIQELKSLLEALGENIANMQETELSMHLKKISHQRYLKVWHDHSSIAGHGHLLVTVSCIYDPAFYYTPVEVAGVDVQSIVERPELHILGRSTSSLEDQALFNQCRLDCVKELAAPIFTSTGVAVRDILRFFHGDGPAQQYEAGNSVGGVYPCVSCGIESKSIQNLEHSFKCPTRTLKERRDFIIKGDIWRKGGTNFFEKMKVGDIRKELNRRGVSTEGKKKPELEEIFRSIRQGITNIPPLLQPNPMANLEEIQLGQYEVAPCEPLHDLKGHFSNIIDESEHLLTGSALDVFKQVKAAVLNKTTLRCSDYRRAMVLMYLRLKEYNCEKILTEIFRTGLEISQLLYTHDYNRTQQTVLALHNTTFIHGLLCSQLFSNPVTMTSCKMFGRFYHSLTTHTPILFRIISMRSINTENQERIFGQAKAITKATSCNRPNEVITNIILRVQMEEAAQDGTDDRDESDVKKLSKAVGPRPNTIFSNTLMAQYPAQYQAHLERISDFLLPGEGVWWKYVAQGVEFLDGGDEEMNTKKEPRLMHYRGQSLPEVELYLEQKWEECMYSGITVPANSLKYYTPPEQITSPEPTTMLDNSESCTSNPIANVSTMGTTCTAIVECTTPIAATVSTSMINTVRISQPEYSHKQPKPQYYTSLVQSLYEHNILQPSKTLAKFDLVRHKLKNLSSSSTVNDALQTEYTKLRLLVKNKIQKRIMELTLDTKLQNIAKRLLSHEWKTG